MDEANRIRRNEYARNWYWKNREKCKAAALKRSRANAEKGRERARKYYKEHREEAKAKALIRVKKRYRESAEVREQVRIRCKKHREKDPEAYKSYLREYFKKNRARMKEKSKEWEAKNIIRVRVYRTWTAMRSRCLNENSHDYHRYGGRGITICSGWIGSFDKFMSDMGERPEGTQIDRIDNSKGYWCGNCEECASKQRTMNCRWVTSKENQNNKRTNRFITVGGVTKTLGQWSEETGAHRAAIANRLAIGWPPELAIKVMTKEESQRIGDEIRAKKSESRKRAEDV